MTLSVKSRLFLAGKEYLVERTVLTLILRPGIRWLANHGWAGTRDLGARFDTDTAIYCPNRSPATLCSHFVLIFSAFALF